MDEALRVAVDGRRSDSWNRWSVLVGVAVVLLLTIHLLGQLDPSGGHHAEADSASVGVVASTDGHAHAHAGSPAVDQAAADSVTASSVEAMVCHVLAIGCGILLAVGLTRRLLTLFGSLTGRFVLFARISGQMAVVAPRSDRLSATTAQLCVSRT